MLKISDIFKNIAKMPAKAGFLFWVVDFVLISCEIVDKFLILNDFIVVKYKLLTESSAFYKVK